MNTCSRAAIGRLVLCSLGLIVLRISSAGAADLPFLDSEIIFPLEHWHNHASCIVEAANGDLLVCWFHGSGERTADDVKIEGARLRKGERSWSPRYTMADTPGYPDTNCAMFIDPQGRLWLLWPTILANEWHTALMKYQDFLASTSATARLNGSSATSSMSLPDPNSESQSINSWKSGRKRLPKRRRQPELGRRILAWLDELDAHAQDKLYTRLGWMTRAHPFVLDNTRLIVPLYSDGFSFSLMAITDDWGKTWHTSRPLIADGNIQPSIVQRRDGSLFTLMRDNGPPPNASTKVNPRTAAKPGAQSKIPNCPIPVPGRRLSG